MSDPALLTIGTAAVTGLAATVVATRLRVPAIVLLLATGAILGTSGLAIVLPASLGTGLPTLVELAVAVILFEGGISLRIAEFRASSGPIRNLLTLGALVTFVGASVLAWLLLGFSPSLAAVTGAILIVTGPTVVTPLLRFIRPSPRLAHILRWEGILIDPLGALTAVVVLEAVLAGESGAGLESFGRFFKSCVVGCAVGAAGGLLVDVALRVPALVGEALRSPVALAVALGTFAGAESIVPDSGLFAVTVAGLVLAGLKSPGLDEIEHFKGTLTTFVLALIFVLLAAGVDLEAVATLGWRGVLFLAGLVIVRAAAVALSTMRSSLDLREKVFLAWIAPRGVVAAGVASIFSEVLVEHGVPRAEELRGAVFLVIVGTVVLQGATGRWVARRLAVVAPPPNEIVIVGADRFGRLLATELAAAKIAVTLLDKNPYKLCDLDPAVRTLCGDAQDEDDTAAIDRDRVACVLAATPNDGVNALVCFAFARDVGAERVAQIPSSEAALSRGARHAATTWPFAFGDRFTLDDLARVERLRRVPLDRPATAEELRQRLGTDFRPLVQIDRAGVPSLVRVRNSTLGPQALAIGFETADAAPALAPALSSASSEGA